jgi:protein disulfide-isomerase A1
VFTACFAEIEKEDGVLILTEENFNEAIAAHPKLLVEFYAPWCGHCKKLVPEYAGAAEVLGKQTPPLYVAKVDATVHAALGTKYGVSGYPTLKWFVNGEPTEYGGGRTKDEIVNWINKRSGPPSKSVDAAGLDKEIEANKVTVVFFGAEGADFTNFEKAASADDKRTFIHTSDSEAATKHGVTAPKVVLFRKFDEPKVVHDGSFEARDISKFVEEHSVPTLINFSDEYIEPIFQK